MKKILALLTALALMCSMFVCVSAANDPTFQVTSAKANAGEEVTLDINVLNNPGITAMAVSIAYDSTYISLTEKATNCNLFSGGSVVVGGNAAANPYKINWSEDFDNFYENGVFAQLKFKVADNAPDGVYEIAISYKAVDVYDANMEEVTFATVNGAITVGGEDEGEDEPTFTNPTFQVTSAKANAGEEVTLDINVLNNPGITAMAVSIAYDSTYISLTEKATNCNLFSGGSVVVGGNAAANPYKINWSEDFDNFYENGVFAQLKFKVADNAPDGVYEIAISYKAVDVYDANMEEVAFDTYNGKITVGNGEVTGPTYTETKLVYADGALTLQVADTATFTAAKVVVVTYSDTDCKRFLDVHFVDVTCKADSAQTVTYDVDSGAKTKAMLWLDNVNCQPLADAINW